MLGLTPPFADTERGPLCGTARVGTSCVRAWTCCKVLSISGLNQSWQLFRSPGMWFGVLLHADGALRTQGIPPSITLPSLRWKVQGAIICSSPGMWETRARSLGREDPLEKEMATHSSTLAWRIPWREEPGRLHTVHGVAKS